MVRIGEPSAPGHPGQGAARGHPRPGALSGRALEHWMRVYRRLWRGSLISGFLAPLLYLGALGFGLGSLVDAGPAAGLGGVKYALFVAPGLLAAASMQTAAAEAGYPVMGATKWTRQYHAMLASPLGLADVVLGHLAYIVVRTAIVATAFALVGMLLGAFTSWWVIGAVPVAVLCGAAHAAPIMAFSVSKDDDTSFSILSRFVIIPAFLFSGTFFPIDQLPALLRPLARATPLWHGVSACRDIALTRAQPLITLGHLAYLMVWVAGGLYFAGRAYRARLCS